MTDGKHFLDFFIVRIIITLILASTIPTALSERSPSVLRGGLVYSEESHEGPVYLDQNFYTFIRKTDTSVLQKTAQLCRDLTYLYNEKCSEISASAGRFHQKLNQSIVEQDKLKKSDPFEVVLSPTSDFLANAPAVCKSMNARLPEIRDQRSREKIRQAAIENNITKIAAGISFDEQTDHFRFNSDLKSITDIPSPWKSMWYGGAYVDVEHEEKPGYYYTKYYAPDYPVIYSNPNQDFRLKMADTKEVWTHTKILCEKLKPSPLESLSKDEASSPLIQLADHSCRRDMNSLMATTELLMGQMSQITTLNVTIKQNKPNLAIFLLDIVKFNDALTIIRPKQDPEDTLNMSLSFSNNSEKEHI